MAAYDDCHEWTVRAVDPGDGPALEAMHARCSAATRRARWHGVSRRIPRGYLAEVLAGVPWHVAVAGVADGRVRGLASARDEGDHWEIAVLVEDAGQHDGLGRALLAAMVDAVQRAGGTRVGADVLAGNPVPVHLAASFGAAVVTHVREEVRVTVDLRPRPLGRPAPSEVVVGVGR